MNTERNGNVVELVDGIICYKQVGDQTRDVSIRTVQALLLLTKDLDEVRLLADYSQSGEIGEDTIRSGLYAMKSIAFEKVAIFGASEYLVSLIKTLAQEAGMTEIIHFFKSQEEAFALLKQPISIKSDTLSNTVRA